MDNYARQPSIHVPPAAVYLPPLVHLPPSACAWAVVQNAWLTPSFVLPATHLPPQGWQVLRTSGFARAREALKVDYLPPFAQSAPKADRGGRCPLINALKVLFNRAHSTSNSKPASPATPARKTTNASLWTTAPRFNAGLTS